MIWATVSFWSCFCWLYRASPSLAAKNIISLISVLIIWWCPCVESSLMLLERCLLWPVRSLGKTLLAFALLHSVLQGQICLLLQGFLDFLILHSILIECGPLEKGMANHFSTLALGTPWTVWKGKVIGHWKRSSPGWQVPNMLLEIRGEITPERTKGRSQGKNMASCGCDWW